MVELNTTIFPLLGPIGTVVNSIKVIIGGVFGLYLIILYIRLREYIVMKRLLTAIRKDIRVLAEKQGVEMEPLKESKIRSIGMHIKEKLRQKPEEPLKISKKKKKK